MDIIAGNNRAIRAIYDDADYEEAQRLFRANYRKIANHVTLNNLGAHYYTNGMYRHDFGRPIYADKVGCRYLCRAAEMGSSDENTVIVAKVLYDAKKYDEALEKYKILIAHNPDPLLFSNIACCYYYLGNNVESTVFLKKALTTLTDLRRADYGIFTNYSILHYAYIFSLYQTDIGKAKREFKKIIKKNFDHNSLEEFALAYLLGEDAHADRMAPIMNKQWAIPPEVLAMCFQFYFDRNDEETAKIYLTKQVNSLKDLCCDTRKDVRQRMVLFNQSSVRKKMIDSYKVEPYFFEMEYYIRL